MVLTPAQDIASLEEFRQDREHDDVTRITYERKSDLLNAEKTLETAIRSFGIEPLVTPEQKTPTAPKLVDKAPKPAVAFVEQPIVPIETSAPADTYARVVSEEEKRTHQNPGQNTELNVAAIQADVSRAYMNS